MSLTINSSQASTIALRSLQRSQNAVERALTRLSTGQNAPSARYDTAGVAISSRIRGEMVSLQRYRMNAQQSVAVLQTAEGSYQRVQDMLIRMRSLAAQAQGGNISATERGMLDTEFQQIKNEITRLSQSTKFAGSALFEAGNISFGSASATAAAGSEPVVIADFNGDGIKDMISISNGAGTASLALGRGDGTFDAGTTVISGMVLPTNIVTGDFNGDGRPDVAVAGGFGTFVYQNGGNNTFTQVGLGLSGTIGLTVADVNGDGMSDLVAATAAANYRINISTGSGFTSTTYTAGITIAGISAGDINNDGVVDLVFNSTTQVQGAIGNGSSFSNGNIHVIGGFGTSLTTSQLIDMNNDGMLDIVLNSDNAGTGTAYIVANSGSGNFAGTQTGVSTGGFGLHSVTAADLNGDGINDLVFGKTASAGIAGNYMMGTGTFTFGALQLVVGSDEFSSQPLSVYLADLNNDGRLDFISRFGGYIDTILNTSALGQEGTIRVGASAATINNVAYRIGSTRLNSLDNQLEYGMINSIGAAKRAEQSIKRALNQLTLFRTSVGAAVNRLEKVQDNIATIVENLEGARSSIADLDVAKEMTEYTAQKIVQQAGISMLGQAHASQKYVAKLLEAPAN